MNRSAMVWIPFLVITVEAVFSVPLLSWELATGGGRVGAVWVILGATGSLCWVTWRWREKWSRILCGSATYLDSLSTRRWIGSCFLLGTALRMVWAWRYPAPQHSDHATYFQLARMCLENHHYGFSNGGIAFWPPGYPFFLVAWFLVLGIHPWIPLLANFALFGGILICVERLTTRIAGSRAGKVSAALLVAWPTFVMTAILASKEMLVLFLLCAAMLIFANAQDSELRGRSFLSVILAGLLLGYACLTQPSVQLFPCVLLVYVCLRKQSYLRGFGQVLIVTLVLCAVVVPWTLRNHRVLGAWVPISTNGGDVFYRANNPLATGGYTPRGEQSLEVYDEVNRGKVGFRLGKEWILSHPSQFFALALRKQMLFLGDDAQGAFETLKRGLGIGGLPYIVWKGVSNVYWLGLWLLILVALSVHWRGRLSQDPLLLTILLSIAYLYVIHSVFESGAKYHQPLMGYLAVVAALAFVKPNISRQNKGH